MSKLENIVALIDNINQQIKLSNVLKDDIMFSPRSVVSVTNPKLFKELCKYYDKENTTEVDDGYFYVGNAEILLFYDNWYEEHYGKIED